MDSFQPIVTNGSIMLRKVLFTVCLGKNSDLLFEFFRQNLGALFICCFGSRAWLLCFQSFSTRWADIFFTDTICVIRVENCSSPSSNEFFNYGMVSKELVTIPNFFFILFVALFGLAVFFPNFYLIFRYILESFTFST